MKVNKCGFNISKDCTEECRYYRTCTRNLDYEKLRESRKYGRKEKKHQQEDAI